MRTLILIGLVGVIGCQPSGAPTAAQTEPASGTPMEPSQVAQAEELDTVLSELRQSHRVRREGASCDRDADCHSVLRCIEGSCAFPPAMTGEHDNSTPMIIFEGGDGEVRYYMETAISLPEQQRGLMFRRTIASEWGMVFIYPEDGPRSFWMRNTYIPLDMVFINDSGTVVTVLHDVPAETLESRPSTAPARYVVELAAGETELHGITEGSHVELLNFPEMYLPGH